ncbi:DUF7668 domain-containing protein [Jannaschia ovalis]|uniref:DUF7668 domain-containing protein n=1 Tax=Jannaschia ovalis TaxID=3038773 RepID=A0ABY8LD19_9RHOB|nr:hypothetical protein [Jannaschia sp. GRR-S6-38]WGH78180.1 hypothetical protein P8627_14255 [Jannaschia sp. GRR-S6-38]
MIQADEYEKILRTAERIVQLIGTDQLDELSLLQSGTRLKPEAFRRVMAEHGKTFVFDQSRSVLPIENAVVVDGSSPTRYAVDIPLQTREEGRSDLEVRATFFLAMNERDPEILGFEIDDILIS